jgi:hypothetical protein
MRRFSMVSGLALGVSLCAACADTSQNEINAIVESYCNAEVACSGTGNLEECAKVYESVLAGFTHVYGPLCLDAWLALLDCETPQPCSPQPGCEPEQETLDAECGFGQVVASEPN